MTEIHPTAIVDPAAKLGANVRVGPYSIIGPEVEIGDGSEVASHCVIEGKTTIGTNNKIGIGTLIGAFPQDLSFSEEMRSEVRIGDNNVLREYVTIHRGTNEGSSTVLGNNNFIMGGCHFAHNCQIGNHCIFANNSVLGGHVQFADRIVTGGSTLFHQFIRVGTYAMIRGSTGYSKDVPPYTVGSGINEISGLNTVGLRRAGFSPALRQEIARAYAAIYRNGMNISQALEEVAKTPWSPECQAFFDFIKTASTKGVCKARTASRPPSE